MRRLFLFLLSLPLSAIGFGDTLHVPGQYSTIQDAINASSNGDTVLVAPGSYMEHINFQGRAITLTSENGPKETFIQGAGYSVYTLVTFENTEGPDSVLDGFTIRNGCKANPGGGGVLITQSSPTIQNNHFYNNFAGSTVYDGKGAAIYCYAGSPVIRNNVIWKNTALEGSSSSSSQGGAIYSQYGNPVITGNLIYSNEATYGGGIFSQYSLLEITHNSINFNAAKLGAGIYCVDGSGRIASNTILKNEPTRQPDGEGGGMRLIGYYTVENNIIAWNHSSGKEGGIECRSSTISLHNNVIFGNTAAVTGGGISCTGGTYTMANTILWGNDAPKGPQIFLSKSLVGFSTLNLDYSVVEEKASSAFVEPDCTLNWGAVIVEDDPLFVDPQVDGFHLTRRSPCINRGCNDSAPSDDIDSDPRPFMGTVEIGADEFTDQHILEADLFALSEAMGGEINFTLNAGSGYGNRKYLVLGSATGTVPEYPLPGGQSKMPLAWDLFTDLVVLLLNTPYCSDFLGQLDTAGFDEAQFKTWGPLPPGTAGVTLHLAYALGFPWEFTSNPIQVAIY